MSGNIFNKSFGLAVLALAAPSFAQSGLTFSVGGGRTIPTEQTGSRLDTGFNLTAGIGYHPVRAFGVMAEFGYHNMKVTQTALDRIGVPEGSGRIMSATLNPMLHFLRDGPLDFYVIGGGGYYRRTVEFTAPSAVIATAFDPFYGIAFPVAVPTTTVLGSFTQNRVGINGGGGFALRLGAESRTTLFAETRFHHIYTSPVRTNMLPITIGLRF